MSMFSVMRTWLGGSASCPREALYADGFWHRPSPSLASNPPPATLTDLFDAAC
jgi:hypothetical protein